MAKMHFCCALCGKTATLEGDFYDLLADIPDGWFFDENYGNIRLCDECSKYADEDYINSIITKEFLNANQNINPAVVEYFSRSISGWENERDGEVFRVDGSFLEFVFEHGKDFGIVHPVFCLRDFSYIYHELYYGRKKNDVLNIFRSLGYEIAENKASLNEMINSLDPDGYYAEHIYGGDDSIVGFFGKVKSNKKIVKTDPVCGCPVSISSGKRVREILGLPANKIFVINVVGNDPLRIFEKKFRDILVNGGEE